MTPQTQEELNIKGDAWKRMILAKHYKHQEQITNGFVKSKLRDRIVAISEESVQHNTDTVNKIRLNQALMYSANSV